MSSLAIAEADDALTSTQDRARAYFDRRFPGRKVDRVLLVTPPDATAAIFDPLVARRGTYSNFPPYGLAILAQHLRALGIAVELLNLNHEVLKSCKSTPSLEQFDFDAAWQRPLAEAIERFEPQLVGATCMFTMTHESLRRVCEFIAEARLPVVIGGVHVSNDVDRVLRDIPAADIAIIREGDVAFPRLIQVIRGEEPVESLGQTIISDDGQGPLRFAAECTPTTAQMDVIPAFDLFDTANLSQYGVIGSFHCFKPKTTRFATVLSNRGCRARCTFCSVRNFNGKGVRQRSVDSVLDELQELEEVYGIGHVMWLDDDLLKDEDRAVAVFNGMIKRGLKLTWDASNGVIASSCTDEVVAAAAASGCVGLIIGMESGNRKILRDIRKPGTVENFVRAAQILKKYDSINSSAYLIVGFPGETMAMIKDTIQVSLDMDMDWYRIKTLQPLPGTPIYIAMKEQGLLEEDQSSTKVRYVTGAYGKFSEEDRLPPAGLDEVFDAIPDNVIPTQQQIDDIWFYMNYALNYQRVNTYALGYGRGASAPSVAKLRQHQAFATDICDLISPENPFALYTAALLTKHLDGSFDAGKSARLNIQLSRSPFWRERFRALNLSPADLAEQDLRSPVA